MRGYCTTPQPRRINPRASLPTRAPKAPPRTRCSSLRACGAAPTPCPSHPWALSHSAIWLEASLQQFEAASALAHVAVARHPSSATLWQQVGARWTRAAKGSPETQLPPRVYLRSGSRSRDYVRLAIRRSSGCVPWQRPRA